MGSKIYRSSDSQQSSGRNPANNTTDQSGSQNPSDAVDSSHPINQGGPPAFSQASVNNNNLLIDVDFEGAEDTMGDLQSPQYVKRTAHMFDSRFATEPVANSHEINERNPSYLNVSKSVSGYSCLTYNTATSETVSTKSVLGNGASLLSGGTRASATRHKTDFALHSPFSRKSHHTDDDSDHSSSQSTTSPPPSLPPINTTSSGRFTESPFFQNAMSRGEELLEESPYIPSHGKSFIMQRIERLYGSDAVSNKSIVARKSSHVTTISITRESAAIGKERIIPIKVEPRDDDDLEYNLYNSGVMKKLDGSGDEDMLVGSKSNTTGTTIIYPEIVNEENGRRIQQHRRSRGSVEDTDEDEDGIRTRSSIIPVKSRASIDNSGHLNGNANPYGNGLSGSAYKNHSDSSTSTTPADGVTNGKITIIHSNGNHHNDGDNGQDCTVLKKTLSRESSAESDDTNGCSENSLELSISDTEPKSILSRKDSQDNPLYSNRGSTSPVKPKPKPKPKDMALLRTLSRSPALKTGTENIDKTAISLNIIQSDAVSQLEDFEKSADQTDADGSGALFDIKNSIASTVPKITPENKISFTELEQNNHVSEKENIPSSVTENTTNNLDEVKDGNYYKKEMDKVRVNIQRFSEKAAQELESLDESEDRAGSIHAAVGKGNLLVKKKFKQFDELCDANLKGKSGDEPETTNEDLGGFWDMVLIQVDQIYSLFADLEKKEQQTDSEPSTPRKSPKKVSASASKPGVKSSGGVTPKVNSAAAKARDEARKKLLAEKRRAMKNQMQDPQEVVPEVAEVQIFTPNTTQTG